MGWRITSKTVRLNSGNSTKNKIPLWAKEISPGCGKLPPPTKATSERVCCPIVNFSITAEKPEYRPFPPESDKSLGAALKSRRLDVEWTQQQVADHLEIGKDCYQNFEWNFFNPHIRNRKKINQFLGFNYWDDMSGELQNRSIVFRVEKGLTMTQLARKIGISCSTVERLEKGSNISESTKIRFEEFLITNKNHPPDN